MHARIGTRVASVAPSPTLAVDAKAKSMRAQGVDVIGFGAGEPDFPTPGHIVEAARRAAADPANHKYSPAAGLPALREAVAARARSMTGVNFDPSQVLVANGAKQAVYEALAAIVDPGDEVLYGVPVWTTYCEQIKLAGGVPVGVETDEAAGFHLTREALEEKVTGATKALILVSPSNPTGAVLDEDELRAIGELALDADLFVVTDEIYSELLYGGRSFHSILAVVPELADRAILVDGVSKSYAMTGWRVGWIAGPTDVVAAAADLQSQLSSNVSNVSQRAALAALEGGTACVAQMREAFDRRRLVAYKMLSEMHGVTCAEPEGAFYAFPSVSGLMGAELAGRRVKSTSDLAEICLEEAHVAFVPGEAFESPGYLRISYALADDLLEEGLSRLAKLFETAG